MFVCVFKLSVWGESSTTLPRFTTPHQERFTGLLASKRFNSVWVRIYVSCCLTVCCTMLWRTLQEDCEHVINFKHSPTIYFWPQVYLCTQNPTELNLQASSLLQQTLLLMWINSLSECINDCCPMLSATCTGGTLPSGDPITYHRFRRQSLLFCFLLNDFLQGRRLYSLTPSFYFCRSHWQHHRWGAIV